jgi:hypothetical protein
MRSTILQQWQLVQIFYYGLEDQLKRFVDASCGGNFLNKDVKSAYLLFEEMSENSFNMTSMDTFGRSQNPRHGVHEIDSKTTSIPVTQDDLYMLAQRLDQMQIHQKKIEEKLTNKQAPHVHSPHTHPPHILRRENLHNIDATSVDQQFPADFPQDLTGNFDQNIVDSTSENIYALQEQFRNPSNTSNQNWRTNPNHSWKNPNPIPFPKQNYFGNYGQPMYQPGPSQDDINNQVMKTLQGMQTQMTEVTRMVTNLQQQVKVTPDHRPIGNLPSQPMPNPNNQRSQFQGGYHSQPIHPAPQHPPGFNNSQAPRPHPRNNQTANAVTLRNGKTTQNTLPVKETRSNDTQINSSPPIVQEPIHAKQGNPAPFPQALHSSKKKKTKSEPTEKELMDLFGQVEINIPLLDAIKYIPAYAKFLKDLCTPKRLPRNLGKVTLPETISSVVQSRLPIKRKDPGAPLVQVIINDISFDCTLLDLGASINLILFLRNLRSVN